MPEDPTKLDEEPKDTQPAAEGDSPPPAAEPPPAASPPDAFDFDALEKLAAEEGFGSFEDPAPKKGKKASAPDDDRTAADLRAELAALRSRQEDQARLFEQSIQRLQQPASGGPDFSKLTPEQRVLFEMKAELEELRQASYQSRVNQQVAEFERQIEREIGSTKGLSENEKVRRLADGYMRARMARDKSVTPAQAAREVADIVEQIGRGFVNDFIKKARARSRQKTTGSGGVAASGAAAPAKKFTRKDWEAGKVSSSLGDTLARMLGRG